MNTSKVTDAAAQAKPEHTAEPWTFDEHGGTFFIFGPDGGMVADGNIDPMPDEPAHVARIRGVGRGATVGEQRANAARIVACVNACAGVADMSDVKVDELMDIAQAGYALATYAGAAKDCGNTPEFMAGLEQRIERVRVYFETGAKAGARR